MGMGVAGGGRGGGLGRGGHITAEGGGVVGHVCNCTEPPAGAPCLMFAGLKAGATPFLIVFQYTSLVAIVTKLWTMPTVACHLQPCTNLVRL